MDKFIFDSYSFDRDSLTASFNYKFSSGRSFSEIITFSEAKEDYNKEALEQALFLSFILMGVSYYKTFPTKQVALPMRINKLQADFFNSVYQEGLGQFAYENKLTRQDLAHFEASAMQITPVVSYQGQGIIALQSGGKDSLLTATLLNEKQLDFSSLYVSSSDYSPDVIDKLDKPKLLIKRSIDYLALNQAKQDDGLDGHIPITYLIQSLALVQAILSGKKYILTSIAHEGEEPHSLIGDLPVNHQWSKTWQAEQLFANYVNECISSDIFIGSPLRRFSELKVAEMFSQKVWADYKNDFSSCNIANYKQGQDNRHLSWCGYCPKCVNSYLLFAPFVIAEELKGLFNNKDLFVDSQLEDIFKGLLNIDGVAKPFECIGEVDELRLAYHLAMERGSYGQLPFEVPPSNFDYNQEYPYQTWLDNIG